MTKVTLRSGTHGIFSVLVFGIYSEAIYGEVGDSVAFEGPGIISVNRVFRFEQLKGCAVVTKNRKANHTAEPASPGRGGSL